MSPDKLFKIFIRIPAFFRAFIQLFLPKLAPHVDFDHLEPIDKERFTLDGRKREGDVLIKTRLIGQDTAFLFHLESQDQPQRELPARMLEYVALDHRDCGVPVYPIALITCHWPGVKELSPLVMDFPDKRVLMLDFEVVVLEDLLAWDYVRGGNPAGMAMSGGMWVEKERRVELALAFLESVAGEKLGAEEREVLTGYFLGSCAWSGGRGCKCGRS